MSTQYNIEPNPSATVLLKTTAGPLTISIFASQTPLASRNFLQLVLDGYYTNCIFHRVSPGFVIQTGDPTGTGEGGANIYEDRDLERYDAAWARELGREVGEKITFGDEIHSRLKFNRRGLVGMARMGEGYGSQFFITLGDTRRELDGKCTMFGRVEGDGIYNVVKIAEGELAEGTERPVFPEKILSAEVLELPKSEGWRNLKKRERVATKGDAEEERPRKMAKRDKKKGGKALLSFGDEDGGDGAAPVVQSKKAKFNPKLINAGVVVEEPARVNGSKAKRDRSPPIAKQKESSPSPKQSMKPMRVSLSSSASRSPETSHHRKPSFHESTTQFPIRDPEIPSRSFSTTPDPDFKSSKTSNLNAEIAALKASMRRNNISAPESRQRRSALEQMIPETSTKGRKRPRPGENNAKGDASALKMLNAFRARLDNIGSHKDVEKSEPRANHDRSNGHSGTAAADGAEEDEEAALCDLHFIANCQSCSRWDEQLPNGENGVDDDDDREWMSHALSFEKDRLGKDLTWRRKNEDELVVIDPREKEREIKKEQRDKRRGRA